MSNSQLIRSILYTSTLLCSCLSAGLPNKELSIVVEDKNPLKILTPSLKNVQTKKLILTNEIKVYLISDSAARSSSAALAVNVGQWHDDPKYPGIAHFCEHMLFMGSKKYPDENKFMKLIQDNGGMRNAYTSLDRTVYMFSINNDQFSSALDVFSRFFIDPLFTESAIGRELLAVNQEYKNILEHDGWRHAHILKQEGNQNHPNKNFSCGTEDTLKIIGRDNLIKWYKENYKSNGMYLVVYSNKDLDSLTALVEETFANVEHSKELIPVVPYAKITSPEQEAHITYIEPVKDLKKLSITWEIPPAYTKDLDKKTYELIAHSLTHRMKGSLYTLLKEEGLIEDLVSDCSKEGKDHLLLSIEMDLTIEGMQKRDHILYLFFSALNKLKQANIPAHIYHDMHSVLKTTYKWQSRRDPFSMVKNCAHNMVDEDLSTFPYKTYMISDFDQKSSRDLLNFLSPYNALITVVGSSKDTHRTANKQEPWTGAKYSISEIGEDMLTAWDSAPAHPSIIPPNPNPYISKHQTLLTEVAEETIQNPILIARDNSGQCYFWQDKHYLIPKTQIMIRIKSPEINDTAKSICLNDLYSSYLYYHMASLISEGAFADINTQIYAGELGLNISVDGYNDKIGSYMMSFLSSLTSTSPSKEEFLLVKEQMISSCINNMKALPYAQGMALLKSLISNTALDNHTKKQSIEDISFEEFRNFHKSILAENYLKIFISGNLDRENALLHFTEIKNTISSKECAPCDLSTPKYIPFYDQTPTPTKIQISSEMRGNAAILAIDHGCFSFDSYASISTLDPIIQEAFFTELRSKQQTGYITASITRSVEGQMIRYFIVQSTTHSPEELLARYELFLENFSKTIEENISQERFEGVKNSLITQLKLPTENLSTFAAINFELAYTFDGDFERNKKKIESLETLDYKTFIEYSKKSLSRDNRKRLAVLVKGNKIDAGSFGYTEKDTKELSKLRR